MDRSERVRATNSADTRRAAVRSIDLLGASDNDMIVDESKSPMIPDDETAQKYGCRDVEQPVKPQAQCE